jgi:EAL domain-containing protein (putative c-di-GMP-specific phosphodiesterase class I)
VSLPSVDSSVDLGALLQHRSPKTGAAFAAEMLAVVRRQLGLEIGFISEFRDGNRVFLFVDTELSASPIRVGDSDPLADSYCGLVVDGTLPQVMPDAAAHPVAARLPVTAQMCIGGHVSVPIRRGNGEVFGTLCCFSTRPEPGLGDLDLALVQLVGQMLGSALESDADYYEWHARLADELESYCSGALETALQPIVDLNTGHTVGYEALSRFPGSPAPPDTWFATATAIGWGPRLEAAAVASALASLGRLPAAAYLSINASPEAVTSPEFAAALTRAPLRRLVVEITEQTSPDNNPDLVAALSRLRQAGARIAMDDAGSGYAGLRQVLALRPDILKLDRDLVRDVDSDPARQALAMSLAWFANRSGAKVVAEGIETVEERDMVRSLGIQFGQGYLLGRPESAIPGQRPQP